MNIQRIIVGILALIVGLSAKAGDRRGFFWLTEHKVKRGETTGRLIVRYGGELTKTSQNMYGSKGMTELFERLNPGKHADQLEIGDVVQIPSVAIPTIPRPSAKAKLVEVYRICAGDRLKDLLHSRGLVPEDVISDNISFRDGQIILLLHKSGKIPPQ